MEQSDKNSLNPQRNKNESLNENLTAQPKGPVIPNSFSDVDGTIHRDVDFGEMNEEDAKASGYIEDKPSV